MIYVIIALLTVGWLASRVSAAREKKRLLATWDESVDLAAKRRAAWDKEDVAPVESVARTRIEQVDRALGWGDSYFVPPGCDCESCGEARVLRIQELITSIGGSDSLAQKRQKRALDVVDRALDYAEMGSDLSWGMGCACDSCSDIRAQAAARMRTNTDKVDEALGGDFTSWEARISMINRVVKNAPTNYLNLANGNLYRDGECVAKIVGANYIGLVTKKKGYREVKLKIQGKDDDQIDFPLWTGT